MDPGHPLREAQPHRGHSGQCSPPHRTQPGEHVSQRQGRRRTSVRPEAGCALPRCRGPTPPGPPPTAPTIQTGTQRPEDATHLPVEKDMVTGRCLDAPAPPEGTHPEWPSQTHPGIRGALLPEPGWPVDTPGAGPGAPAALNPGHLPGQSLVSQSTNACQGSEALDPRVCLCFRRCRGDDRDPGSGLTPRRATR